MTILPVTQVLTELLTFQITPLCSVMVSSLYWPRYTVEVLAPVA